MKFGGKGPSTRKAVEKELALGVSLQSRYKDGSAPSM
jgi:hypothetical protein